jgi:oligopeptide transport system substrate-binding protein
MYIASNKRSAFAVLVLAVLAGGCAPRETAIVSGARDGVLHVGNYTEPESLDPHLVATTNAMRIALALYEGLVTLAPDGIEIRPGVAAAWEISPDGTSYTFHLRPGTRWSNGDPLTGRDFVESFQRLLAPELAAPYANFAYPIVGAQDFVEGRSKDFTKVGITMPDERTVMIKLRRRTPYFLHRLAMPPFFPVHLPSVDKAGHRTGRNTQWMKPGEMVTNGPFVLSEWRQNSALAVKRNAHHGSSASIGLSGIRFYPFDDYGLASANLPFQTSFFRPVLNGNLSPTDSCEMSLRNESISPL